MRAMSDAIVGEYEGLVQTFDLLRERHQVDVMQPGLLACVCGERLPIIYGADGQPAFNPIIRHHHEHYASAAAKRVAEFQQTALEMARKAEQAERRAEEAEFHVEQLRDARDSAERRIERAERGAESGCIHVDCVLLPTRPPTYRCGECGATFDHRPEWVKVAEGQQGARDDMWKVTVYQETAQARCEWCGQAGGHENGCRLGLGPDERGAHRTDCNCAPPYADCRHPACDCTECVYDCPGPCGDHEWLNRPESDTRECLICGTEVAG